MKKLVSCLILTVSLVCFGQVTTNDVTIPKPVTSFITFAASATNLMVAPYGIMSTDAKTFGGGVALAYRLSDMIVPTMRLDYYDKELFMPSANLQLQMPLTLFGKVTVIPFGFAGAATALGGRSLGVSSGTVVGIVGIGGAVRINSKWDFVLDYEKWTGFLKDQVRFGILYKF